MFRYLSPAGSSIPLRAMYQALIMMYTCDTTHVFTRKLKDFLNVNYCFLTSSGTTALYLALLSLRELASGAEVIIPAYTCPSILSAVIKAGLQPVLCDLQKDSAHFNYAELKTKISKRTLAIVSVHLFGIPEDMQALTSLTSSHKIFHIEDAAQALGTQLPAESQRFLGTLGDVGIFSFGRGKPLTLMQGGALSTNSDTIAEVVEKKVKTLALQNSWSAMLKALCYALFLHPRLYWIPQRLPLLKLGTTIFNLDFTIKQMDHFTAALGTIMLEHISQLTTLRFQQEVLLTHKLSCYKNYFLTNGTHPLLRFPLLMKNRTQKESVLSALNHSGIGATGMYPTPLNLFKDTKHYFHHTTHCHNATSFSERIITLPLHEFLTERDIDTIRDAIKNAQSNTMIT